MVVNRHTSLWTFRFVLTTAWLLSACAACVSAQIRPMAIEQTQQKIRAGDPIQLNAPSETIDFLLKATERSATALNGSDGKFAIGPNRAGDQVMVAASLGTRPGEYAVQLSATNAAGEQRQAVMDVVVSPRATVPSSATRPPVVLLNGWETGFTNACPISTDSTDTFGNLAKYLIADGVPVVYFFDNCKEDPNQPIEVLANDLAKFLGTITYDNGAQVQQIDLVAHSMGGLIARGLSCRPAAECDPDSPCKHTGSQAHPDRDTQLRLVRGREFRRHHHHRYAERRVASGQRFPVESGNLESGNRRSPRSRRHRGHRQCWYVLQ